MKLVITGTSNLFPRNVAWRVLSAYTFEVSSDPWSDVLARVSEPDSQAECLAWVVCLDDVIPNELIAALEAGEAGTQGELEAVIAAILTPLAALVNASSGVRVIVAWYYAELPSPIRWGRGVPGWEHVAREWEHQLTQLRALHPTLYTLPMLPAFSESGLASAFDSRNYYLAHCRLTSSGLGVLARCLGGLLERISRPRCKVLALDCDNTLWGGVIGEDRLSGIQLGEDGLGRAYQDFQQSALRLSRQGVLLCLVSKNNPEDVWEVFDQHPAMRLRRSDIVAARIGWGEKAHALRGLASELDLGLESIVFWDDNPVERGAVAACLPSVHVPDLPDDVTTWPRLLQRLPQLNAFEITPEDRARQRQYVVRAGFRRELGASSDTRVFLRSLELRAEPRELSPALLGRAAQLCEKTNQFNLRTVRYSQAELQSLAGDPGSDVFLIHLRDRFGDHGHVGLVVMRFNTAGTEAFLDTFLLSCRVLGRHLEAWMLSEAAMRARERGAEMLLAEFCKSERNDMATGFLASHGLYKCEVESAADGCTSWPPTARGELYAVSLAHLHIPHLEYYLDKS